VPVRCLIFLFLLSGLFVLSAQIGAVQFCVNSMAFPVFECFSEWLYEAAAFKGLGPHLDDIVSAIEDVVERGDEDSPIHVAGAGNLRAHIV